MKTCIVTTTWFDNPGYPERCEAWYNYYASLNLGYDFVLFDNASSISKIKEFQKIANIHHVRRFTPFMPRVGNIGYPSLWRAMSGFSYLFNEFDKVVLIDNDFYLLSQKAIDYMNGFQSGWGTVYSPTYKWPEAAFQIITKDCEAYKKFVETPYEEHYGKTMEKHLPFTEVNKDLVGDRYSEIGILKQDETMDFFAQALPGMTFKFGLKY